MSCGALSPPFDPNRLPVNPRILRKRKARRAHGRPIDNHSAFPNNRKALRRSNIMIHRRNFLGLGSVTALGLADRASPAPPPFQGENSKLKITGVRLVRTRPKRPVPAYTPAPGSW